jgi:hypothetical protein
MVRRRPERPAVGQIHDRLVVQDDVEADGRERAAGVRQGFGVLPGRRDEQEVDVVRVAVAEAGQLDVDVGDRTLEPRDDAGRGIRLPGARRPESDSAAADDDGHPEVPRTPGAGLRALADDPPDEPEA